MASYTLTISGMTRETARIVANAASEYPAPGSLAVSCVSRDGDADWIVAIHSEDRLGIPEIKSFLSDVFGLPLGGLTFQNEAIADRDWVTESLQGLAPVRAGRFFIHGSHDRDAVPVNAIPVEIDASLAFGTGHHGTTEGCLLALEQTTKSSGFENILDLGCGTAVLAIAAAKRLKAPVLATDIDNESVRVARNNARRNGVGVFVQCEHATGFAHPVIAHKAPFDLILANILARPLMSLADQMARHIAPGGIAILSGLLIEQSTGVEARYRAAGFTMVSRLRRGEWATLTLRAANQGTGVFV